MKLKLIFAQKRRGDKDPDRRSGSAGREQPWMIELGPVNTYPITAMLPQIRSGKAGGVKFEVG
jgi:hypothetical protein